MQDERTPLVSHRIREPSWAQFAVLTLCRMIHPICFAVILPFIVRYLLSINAASEQNVGLAAGQVEAAYSFAMLVFLYPAGLCSDRFGRKTVLLGSLFGCAVFSSIFGLGRSLKQLILLRLLVGSAVAFLPATVMTMLVEVATKETQSLAFSLVGTGWALGSVLAPMVGGVLSELSATFPSLKDTIWDRYPYLAPGVGAAVLSIIAMLSSIVVLPETLRKSHLTKQNMANASSQTTLFTPAVLFMTFMWVFVIFVSMSQYAAEVVFFATDYNMGGLSLSGKQIALLFSIRSAINCFYGPVAYPWLIKCWGNPIIVFRRLVWLFAAVPLGYYAIARAAHHEWLRDSQVIWATLGSMIFQSILIPAFSGCSHSLVNRAPTRAHIAKISTLSEYASNLGHGLGAFFGSSMFSVFAGTKLTGAGSNVFLVIAAFAVVLSITAQLSTLQPGWRETDDELQAESGDAQS